MGKIKVWIREPFKAPRHVWISNTLKSFQDAVDGYIEHVNLTPEVGIICNEDALFTDKKFNCQIGNVQLFGTIVFIGYKGEEFSSCPLELAEMKQTYPQLWRTSL